MVLALQGSCMGCEVTLYYGAWPEGGGAWGDNDGNNVCHYLADLSATEPEVAIRILDFLCEKIETESELHDILENEVNQYGMTGLEATAKYGSVVFLHHILGHSEITGKKSLVINPQHLRSPVRSLSSPRRTRCTALSCGRWSETCSLRQRAL